MEKRNIDKYYENTQNALPHPLVKKFIGMNISPLKAIDLGCGAGRDTITDSILQERIFRRKFFRVKRFMGTNKRTNGIFI